MKNFFPTHKRDEIAKEIKNILIRDKQEAGTVINQSTNILDQETLQNDIVLANTIKQSLFTVIECIDKGNVGMLTGDLSPKLILWLERYVQELSTLLSKDRETFKLTEHKRNKYITKFFQRLFKVCGDELYKMPVNGIPYPDFENPRNLFERQLLLEDESNDIAIEKFMRTYESLAQFGLAHNLTFSKHHIVKWFPSLCQAIREEQEKCMQVDLTNERGEYGPYLLKLSPEKIALVCLSELMKQVTRMATNRDEDDTSLSYYIVSKIMFSCIGKSVCQQIQYEQQEANIKQRLNESTTSDGQTISKAAIFRRGEMLRKSATEDILRGRNRDKYDSVPKDTQVKIGALLTYLLKETTKIKGSSGFLENLLEVSYTRRGVTDNYIGVLRINEQFMVDLLKQVEKRDNLFIQLERSLPMIYPPADWVDYEIGGYYQKPTNLMRMQGGYVQEKAVKYADIKNVSQVLNLIGGTAWRINKDVLDVVEEIWNLGGGLAEVPDKFYDYKNYVFEYQLNECVDNKEKVRLKRKIQDQRDVHSLRCDFTLKLDQARAFRNVGKIYFPHNLDFRGRVYPIPPHLNHLGADLNRGLLEFSEGKRLGTRGLRWLKIHLANKMGRDKLKMDDREKFTDSIIDLVKRCANDPILNREWQETEDQWQTLAAMIDLNKALQLENPEDYISHIHVHQDGSCNGLQHYAALGRDFEGANQVNLVNRDVPGDLYTFICNMVSERVEKEAQDPTNPMYEIAQKLRGNIKRKIVKQTVMTTVYGVTFIGARKQIHKQLKDKDFLNQDDDSESYNASKYLATLTLECVENLFTQAHEIKQWLKDVAHLVVSSGHPVSWVTPLELPVVQPYRTQSQNEIVQTLLQRVTVNEDPDSLPVNKSKQQTAFPPNYIHSLDSTHLMYTCLRCKEEGVVFAAVHDSFWTHAADIDRMNVLLREEFVKLHDQPLLEKLRKSFEVRYPHLDFPPVPDKGSLDLNEVKKSTYFFS